MLRRIAEQRRKLILTQADRYLDAGETVLYWVRARQVDGRREGFVYLTERRCIVHWTGRRDGVPGDFPWEQIITWGVASDAQGGLTLGLQTESGTCFVRLRATTPAMVEDVAAFVKHFAEQAPEPGGQISEGAHLGAFEPTSAPAVKQQKMTVTDHTRRILVTLLGVAFIVGAIVIIPLPGPFSFVVTIAGLAILAAEYDWARDALDWTKLRYKQAAGKIKGATPVGVSEDDRFMRLALEEARGALAHDDVPVGAIVVADGDVIASARNERQLRQDPTAHAEVLGLRAAAEAVGSWRLVDATVYVTLEPCPMCAGALVLARVARLVYGPQDDRAGAAYSLYNIVQDPRLNHTMQVTPGVLAEDSLELLQTFFQTRRP